MFIKATLVVLGLLALGVSRRASAQDTLLLAPDSLATAGNAIILILPDGGGYLINQQPVPLPDIGQQFRSLYDPRPVKVLLVGWGTKRPMREVDTVVLLAREQGVTVYRILLETPRN